MANEKKLREMKQLFKQEIDRITSDANKWMKFLSTASRLYKYDFEDQILLYDKTESEYVRQYEDIPKH